MTDTIADMLTRIRNAQAVHKTTVRVPFSTLKQHIVDILVTEGYIASATVELENEGSGSALVLTLKYLNQRPAIRELKRISTPGRRVYAGTKGMPYVYENLGIAIISTSKGVMTNKEARRQRVGGEVLCEIF